MPNADLDKVPKEAGPSQRRENPDGLIALTFEWEKKVTAIEKANDISTRTLENLIGNLLAYEVNLHERRKEENRKRSIAFKTIEE